MKARERREAIAIAEQALFGKPNPFDDYEEGTFTPSLWAKRLRDTIDNEILTTINKITGAAGIADGGGDTVQIRRPYKRVGDNIT